MKATDLRGPSRRALAGAALLFWITGASCSASGGSSNAGKGQASAAASATSSPEAPLSSVVAEVNGTPLYRASYEQTLEFLRDRLQSQKDPGSVERFVGAKYDALDMLVNDELLHQEASRQGFAPSEADVQNEFQRAAAAAGGEDLLVASMRARGLRREDVIDSFRRKMAVDRFMKEKVVPMIDVTDAEITSFYNENLQRFTPQQWAKIYQILIRCPRGAPADQEKRARERAFKILTNITRGEPFEVQAREYSEDSSAALSGNMGFVKRGAAYPEFDAIAYSIPLNALSDIIRTDDGFHILKVTERRGGEPFTLEKVRDDIRKILTTRKQASLLQSLTTKLREDAKIVSYLD